MSNAPLPPKLSEEQRRVALVKAVDARRKRADLKQDLRTGKVSLSEVLVQTSNDMVGRMRVAAVLEAMPGIGPARAQRLMERLEISGTRRMRGLGQRQIDSLLKEFTQNI
ncbi:MAG: integration host factor, actinobacterial type [Actinomycetota bacterium]